MRNSRFPDDVITPQILTPEQFFLNVRRATSSGEKRLMLAVLEEAVGTFQTYCIAKDASQRRMFQEVQQWFRSTDTTWAFSFENICIQLGMDADYLRRGLRQFREKQLDAFSRQPKVLPK